MALDVGARLGAYEITGLIGAGGMGEVYRARDTTLNRDVALKVLPELFAADPDRLARFKREAQVLASLNHPHIAAIYGFAEGQALVMELVEGPTLADRIARGPLPLDEALPIARQIADALQDAHEHGIVHRDLKPANIKVRPDGTVKVLDFGLAKAFEGEPASSPALTMSPTITSPAATRVGVILGTAAYMSPEQARGKAVDKRTDLWAFGCVLYEMLVGRRAFDGDEVSDVLAFILTKEPEWTALPHDTPIALRRLLRRCVQKDRTRRLDSAADARLEIDEALSTAPEDQRTPSVPIRAALRERIAWSLVVAALAAAALTGFPYFGAAPPEAPPLRFFVDPPEGWSFPTPESPQDVAASPLAVSPDGRRMAFVALNPSGISQLWIRPLDTLTAQPLPGTEGAHSIFWSPDSETLGFFADLKLKKIDVSGGPPITLADINGRGGTWGRDGTILINPSVTSPLMMVPSAGGEPKAATRRTESEGDHRQPFFLPDGRHFIYVVTDARPAAYVASLDDPEPTMVLNIDSSEVLYSRGHLLFLRDTTLMAQAFDTDRLALSGEAFPVADQIQTVAGGAYGVFTVSETGVLMYRTGSGRSGLTLGWFDRAGKQLDIVGERASYGDLELDPHGTRAAVSVPGQTGVNRDIWVYDIVRRLRTRLTFETSMGSAASWSASGAELVFRTNRNGRWDFLRKSANGADPEELLLADAASPGSVNWSRDGRFIVYSVTTNGNDLWILPLSGDRKPYPFLQTQFSETQARFSPDGRWITYQSNESGRLEIYVTAFPAATGKWQVSTAGGTYARWRLDGTEIYYLDPNLVLTSAAVNGRGSAFEVRSVSALFTPRLPVGVGYPYDVSRDGQRFLVNTLAGDTVATPITVVTDWTADLDN